MLCALVCLCVRVCVDRWVLFHPVCAGFIENFYSPVIESRIKRQVLMDWQV